MGKLALNNCRELLVTLFEFLDVALSDGLLLFEHEHEALGRPSEGLTAHRHRKGGDECSEGVAGDRLDQDEAVMVRVVGAEIQIDLVLVLEIPLGVFVNS